MATKNAELPPTLAIFDWKDRCRVAEQVGRGNGCGCSGLAEWKGKAMWGGRDSVMEALHAAKKLAEGEGVSRATMVAHGDMLLAIGGMEDDGQYSRKVRSWKGKWACSSRIPDMPVGCGQSCVLSAGEYLLVMGGCNKDCVLDVVQVYNHSTNLWSLGGKLPNLSSCGSAVLYGDSVVMLGGNHMATSVWHARIKELVQVQVSSIWKKLPDVPYCWSSVCLVDGVLLAIGGQDNNPSSSKKTSSIHALSLSLRTWLYVGDVPFECSLVDSVVLPGGGLGVIDGAGRQMVQGSVKDLPAQLRSLELDEPLSFREEVGRLKEELGKCHRELELALSDKEKEILASKKLKEELGKCQLALSDKEKEILALRKREDELNRLKEELGKCQLALSDKEKEILASRKREDELNSQCEQLKRELRFEGRLNQLEHELVQARHEVTTMKTGLIPDSHGIKAAHNGASQKTPLEQPHHEETEKKPSQTTPSHPEPTESSVNVSDVFRKHYAVMKETLNPDDLTHHLYTEGLISVTERDNINQHQNTHDKTILLLKAVESAIKLDPKQFDVFLGCLKSVPKYTMYREHLYEKTATGSKLSVEERS